MRRLDRAVALMARRTPWILRGMARLTPVTGRTGQLPESGLGFEALTSPQPFRCSLAFMFVTTNFVTTGDR